VLEHASAPPSPCNLCPLSALAMQAGKAVFGGIGFLIRKTRHAREGLCK
jgi:hypothetical protein